MPVEVILPKVDMDMTHGTLAAWHVAPGGAVAKGAALFDIETDKAAMEIEAPASGHLMAITAQTGDRIAVGTVVALIYAEGEDMPHGTPVIPPVVTPNATPSASPAGLHPVEVILPKVDMDMSHGTIAVWHVAEGGPVTQGAALFDIETDKAAMEVEAPASGILHHVTAAPGDKVPVGSVVAYIYPSGLAVGPPPPRGAAHEDAPVMPVPTALGPLVDPVSDHGAEHGAGHGAEYGAVRATPAARAAARAAGIALAAVSGTGPRRRIQRDDVDAATARAHDLSTPVSWVPQAGALHVSHRRGTGTPLVLFHGFTADSQSWAPLEKALGGNRPLIRVDLPGHGRSPRRRLSGFAELARMMVDAFDTATRDHEQVHLLGHSLGGALALAVADIRPRRVASLSVIAPAGLGPEIDAGALAGIVRASRAESLAPWLRRLTATPDAISDDYARAAMTLRADPALRAVQADMADVLFPDGVQPFDLRPALARLAVPGCMIWGRQDHILPWRHALAADTEYGIHLLSGAGHIPQFECPDRVARILSRHFSATDMPV